MEEETGTPYVMIDSSNVIVDLTIWDGDTEKWTPPTGITCIGIGTDPVAIGCLLYTSPSPRDNR